MDWFLYDNGLRLKELIFEGNKSHILIPKKAVVLVPLDTNLTWSRLKQDL